MKDPIGEEDRRGLAPLPVNSTFQLIWKYRHDRMTEESELGKNGETRPSRAERTLDRSLVPTPAVPSAVANIPSDPA